MAGTTWNFGGHDDSAARAARAVSEAFHWDPAQTLTTSVTESFKLKTFKVFLVQHAFRRREAYYVAVSSQDTIASFEKDSLRRILTKDGISAGSASPDLLAKLFLAFGVVRNARVISQSADVPGWKDSAGSGIGPPRRETIADGWKLEFFSWSPGDAGVVRWTVTFRKDGSSTYREEPIPVR